MAVDVKRYPGQSDLAFPDVFTKAPPMPATLKPGQLNDQQFRQFFEEGYVVVENIFTRDELQEARNDIIVLVDELAQRLYKSGKIRKLYNEYGLFQRLTEIEKDFSGANIILHKQGKMAKGFRDIWSHEKMLNIVEQLLGSPEITGSPVWNLRTKTPRNEPTTVPWHQDNSYFSPEVYNNMIVTAWIPLLDATEFNGCMQMVRKGHQTGKMATHQCCYGGTWYTILEPEEMERTLGVDMDKDLVVCEVPYGGAVIFNNVLPHRSLNNFSNDVRWSLDLRWQKTGTPIGLFDLKDGVPMRDANSKPLDIDWDKFNNIDRHEAQIKSIGAEHEEFDTTIQGPWMKQWELVHMNTHTDAFMKSENHPQMP